MSDDLNIHEEVVAICKRLGLDDYNVRRLDIHPDRVTAEVFKLRDGSKYVDETTGMAAVEAKHFAVIA